MMFLIRVSFTLLVYLWMAAQAHAQERFRLLHRVDSFLTKRYMRSDIDTNYITRPDSKWTLTGRLNLSGANIEAKGRENGLPFNSELKSDYKYTVSMGGSYLGLSVNLALNPAKMLGHYNDFELNFNSYGRRFGVDLSYHQSNSFEGWYDVEGHERTMLSSDVLSMKTLNVNAYYAFNNRRFSTDAAFGHNYIQRRSAGSFMLAVSGQAQKGEDNGDLDFKFSMVNVGIGAGYGYNYVPARGWLLHLTALPTFIVYTKTSLTFEGIKVPMHYHFPEVIITGRGAVVRQFRKKFVGLSMLFNFSNIGNEDILAVNNIKWRMRLFFGIRL